MFWINQRREQPIEEASRCWWPAVCFSPAKLSRKRLLLLIALFFLSSLYITLALLHALNDRRQTMRKWQSRGTVNRDVCRKNGGKCRKKKKMQKLQEVYLLRLMCLHVSIKLVRCLHAGIASPQYDPVLFKVRPKLLFTWQRLTGNTILTGFISEYRCACKQSGCSVQFSD